MTSTPERSVVWVIESDVFSGTVSPFLDAVSNCGHRLITWKDEWWSRSEWPQVPDTPVVFRGSLGNAVRIKTSIPWRPGAYCKTDSFCCSAWYPRASEWLLHREWWMLPANQLVADPSGVLEALGKPSAFFVRPDSPLKPFSGRTVSVERLSLKALDHGYYYQDPTIPVIAAAVRSVQREWRYVVVDRRVIAGSAYAADGRSALPDDPSGSPWTFAGEVAAKLDPPEDVYVMDICEADGKLWLLELNPFSGADLYACNAEDVVVAVSVVAEKAFQKGV